MKLFRRIGVLMAPCLLILGLAASPAGAVTAPAVGADFEPPTYVPGTVHNQDGWQSLGGAGLSACSPGVPYDHTVASNVYGYPTFGAQSLRVSNAVISGCFHDGTFSKQTIDEAGETAAVNGGWHTGGTRQRHFEAAWDFASTVPGAEQPGLAVNASPDRGDGHRMSRVRMADTPTGLEVAFYGVAANGLTFSQALPIATGLDRTVPHRINITMDFVDGPSNDVVRVFVDGALRHTGTSWENYYWFNPEGAPPFPRTVDSVLFRTGPVAAPALQGKGFVIDNLTVATAPLSLPSVVRDSVNWVQGTELLTGGPTNPFTYGGRPLAAFVGDWDGNGTKTPGIFKAGSFLLSNTNVGPTPPVDQTIPFGDPRGFPVAGDFDGDRTDDLAVYRNGLWEVRYSTGATTSFNFGSGMWPSTVPVAGDWDGDGIDGIGTYTYGSGTWQMRQTVSPGTPEIGPFVFWNGLGSYPVVGDWNADGTDSIGVKRGTTWFLRNSSSPGPPDVPMFTFGLANDLPLTWY